MLATAASHYQDIHGLTCNPLLDCFSVANAILKLLSNPGEVGHEKLRGGFVRHTAERARIIVLVRSLCGGKTMSHPAELALGKTNRVLGEDWSLRDAREARSSCGEWRRFRRVGKWVTETICRIERGFNPVDIVCRWVTNW